MSQKKASTFDKKMKKIQMAGMTAAARSLLHLYKRAEIWYLITIMGYIAHYLVQETEMKPLISYATLPRCFLMDLYNQLRGINYETISIVV